MRLCISTGRITQYGCSMMAVETGLNNAASGMGSTIFGASFVWASKAGNINNGMKHCSGEFVLSIDVDFAVYPHLLYRAGGANGRFTRSDRSDAGEFSERRPGGSTTCWEKMHGPKNSVYSPMFWQPAAVRIVGNNSFCYGSVFLARRSALEKIGGIPEDSITEDLYSSYALRGAGYLIRYLNETVCQGWRPRVWQNTFTSAADGPRALCNAFTCRRGLFADAA